MGSRALIFAVCFGITALAADPSVRADEASCELTPTQIDQPPDDPRSDPFPRAAWFINANRTIWAGWDAAKLRAGGNKVMWIRPAGSTFAVNARRLDGPGEAEAELPCCYTTGFQASGMHFSDAGCWEVSATAGDERLTFVTRVAPR